MDDWEWQERLREREFERQRDERIRLEDIEKRDEADGWTQHELLLIQTEKAKKELEGLYNKVYDTILTEAMKRYPLLKNYSDNN